MSWLSRLLIFCLLRSPASKSLSFACFDERAHPDSSSHLRYLSTFFPSVHHHVLACTVRMGLKCPRKSRKRLQTWRRTWPSHRCRLTWGSRVASASDHVLLCRFARPWSLAREKVVFLLRSILGVSRRSFSCRCSFDSHCAYFISSAARKIKSPSKSTEGFYNVMALIIYVAAAE